MQKKKKNNIYIVDINDFIVPKKFFFGQIHINVRIVGAFAVYLVTKYLKIKTNKNVDIKLSVFDVLL